MNFETTRVVRFADCDPAGLVFFPQYLVLLNSVVEEWFDRGLGIEYAAVIRERRHGLPTVHLEVDFTAISRHGETLRWQLGVHKLGRSSFTLAHECLGRDETRMLARQVVVCTSLDTHRPQPLPPDIRAAMQPFAADTGSPE